MFQTVQETVGVLAARDRQQAFDRRQQLGRQLLLGNEAGRSALIASTAISSLP